VQKLIEAQQQTDPSRGAQESLEESGLSHVAEGRLAA
jgi:hypothetical protein